MRLKLFFILFFLTPIFSLAQDKPLFTINGVKKMAYDNRNTICYIDLNDDARCTGLLHPELVSPPFSKAKKIDIAYTGDGIHIAIVGMDDKFHGFKTNIHTPHLVDNMNWDFAENGDGMPITKADIDSFDITSAQAGEWSSDGFCAITKTNRLECFGDAYGIHLQGPIPRENILAVSLAVGGVCVLTNNIKGNLICSRYQIELPKELEDVHFISLHIEESIACAQASDFSIYCWGHLPLGKGGGEPKLEYFKILPYLGITAYSSNDTYEGWLVCTTSGKSILCGGAGDDAPYVKSFLYFESGVRSHEVGRKNLVVLGNDNILRVY